MDLTPALDFIKNAEKCRLEAYRDVVGVWTIGWGQTGGIKGGDTCTQDEADKWLLDRVTALADQVCGVVKVPMNDNQLGALISFCYNLGFSRFESSTLLKLINAGAPQEEIHDEFLKWNHAGGHIYGGLTIRRNKEAELFFS